MQDAGTRLKAQEFVGIRTKSFIVFVSALSKRASATCTRNYSGNTRYNFMILCTGYSDYSVIVRVYQCNQMMD